MSDEPHSCSKFRPKPYALDVGGSCIPTTGFECTECNYFFPRETFRELFLKDKPSQLNFDDQGNVECPDGQPFVVMTNVDTVQHPPQSVSYNIVSTEHQPHTDDYSLVTTQNQSHADAATSYSSSVTSSTQLAHDVIPPDVMFESEQSDPDQNAVAELSLLQTDDGKPDNYCQTVAVSVCESAQENVLFGATIATESCSYTDDGSGLQVLDDSIPDHLATGTKRPAPDASSHSNNDAATSKRLCSEVTPSDTDDGQDMNVSFGVAGLVVNQCSICASTGRTFVCTGKQGFLKHLQNEHNAKLIVADSLNPDESNHPEGVQGDATFRFICPKCKQRCSSMDIVLQHLEGAGCPSSEEVVEEAVVDEGVIVDENITATEDPSQTAEQIVESGRRASDRNAPARCANGVLVSAQRSTETLQTVASTREDNTLNSDSTKSAPATASKSSKVTSTCPLESNIHSISCVRCNRMYSTMKECKVGLLQCTHCRWTFESPCHLRCHIDHFHHHDMQCPACPHFQRKGGAVEMDSHFKTVHPKLKFFHCYLCELEFNTKACLRMHILRHFQAKGSYECPHCHMRFEQQCRVNVHVVRCHSILMNIPRSTPPVDAQEQTTYMCGLCGKKYNYAGSLHLHLKQHKFEIDLPNVNGNTPRVSHIATVTTSDVDDTTT